MTAVKREHERGFTVIETLLATALLIALGIATLGIVSGMTRSIAARSTSSGGSIQTENAMIDMRDDAASAFAVFVPNQDVYGNPNGSAGSTPHEFDYYEKAEDGTESWWAYRYDAATATLRRWDYVPSATGGPTVIGVVNRTTGIVDPAASYPAVTGVRSFSVHPIQADQLASSANTFGPIIASLKTSSGIAPAAEPVGFVPNDNRPRSDLYGGNTTLEVSITTDRTQRTFHLATAAAPSGFTIHEVPAIRAFVYRIDVMHRFWFGFAQKTWARIFEQLQFSFTPATPGTWKVWCDFEIYGAGINGLDLNDRNATYHPDQWNEATAGVFYSATQGDLSHLDPRNCSKRVPSKTTPSATAAPGEPDPDVIDTPPPCFAAGTCWPANAPPNWSPPSPWPAATPPAAWCATHALSTLCGGPGGTPIPITEAPPAPGLRSYTPISGNAADAASLIGNLGRAPVAR